MIKLEISPREMIEMHNVEDLCSACVCVATTEIVEHLYVYMKRSEDPSRPLDPALVLCEKCNEALIGGQSTVVFEKLLPYPKACVVPRIQRTEAYYEKAGLNSAEHVTVIVKKVEDSFGKQ
jgi:hypothetical protein